MTSFVVRLFIRNRRYAANRGYTACGYFNGKLQVPEVKEEWVTVDSCHCENGEGYDISGFYPLVFCQCMYLLKYRSLNSQAAIGFGYVKGEGVIATGHMDEKGMDWGKSTGTQQMKLFGLEDFWGNIAELTHHVRTDDKKNILTTSSKLEAYVEHGAFSSNVSGYMSKPFGTTELGFLPKEATGLSTSYFCDSANLKKGSLNQ